MRGGEARRPSDGRTDEWIGEKERRGAREAGHKYASPLLSFFAPILLKPTAAFGFELGLPSTYLPSASSSGFSGLSWSHTQRRTRTHTAVGSSSSQTAIVVGLWCIGTNISPPPN